jgi:hypothetical protein
LNWDAVGAVGEVLGALAVVLTLGYLARQVHFARETAADANRLNRANGVTEMVLATATNTELLNSISKSHGLAPFHEAYAAQLGTTPDEAARSDFFHVYYFWLHWGNFASITSPKDMAELTNVVSTFYQIPAVRYSWEHSPYAKPILDPEFVEFVESTLSNASKNSS